MPKRARAYRDDLLRDLRDPQEAQAYLDAAREDQGAMEVALRDVAEARMTDRLQKCLDAGSSVALFPLLKDWPEAELVALLRDIEQFFESESEAIDAKWKSEMFQPENFFSKRAAKNLDEAHESAKLTLLAACSEIVAVADLFLDQARKQERV